MSAHRPVALHNVPLEARPKCMNSATISAPVNQQRHARQKPAREPGPVLAQGVTSCHSVDTQARLRSPRARPTPSFKLEREIDSVLGLSVSECRGPVACTEGEPTNRLPATILQQLKLP